LDPIVKTVFVPLKIEDAFQLFTAGYSRWWPVLTHSVGEEQAASCTLECRLGGRIYETLKDGKDVEWGIVLAWEPLHSLDFSWHPGRQAASAQQVEVIFQAVPGGTRATLTHRGWEILGEEAAVVRPGYDSGWEYVLGCFSTVAAQ
jgi:hypothetical protein